MINELISWFGDAANWQGKDGVPNRVWQHIEFTLIALGIAAVIAVPLGLFIGHTGRGGVALVGGSNALRALPTLGLVTFLFLVFKDEYVSAYLALVVLAIPPILAGTYSGVQATDPALVDAADGVGMTGWQRLWQVELPLALPLVLNGMRNATLQVVATVAVAAYVGLGGLGRYLLDGLAILDYGEVAAGAVLTAALALLFDGVFTLVQYAVVPRGVRLSSAAAPEEKAAGVGGGTLEVADV